MPRDATPRRRRRRARGEGDAEGSDGGSDASGSSASDYDPSGEEPGTAGGRAEGPGGGSDSDEGTSGEGSDGGDALGVFDDVDDDVYAARLERWLKAWPRQLPRCKICYYVTVDNAALLFATANARGGRPLQG